MFFQNASANDPIPVDYDPMHPGYYKPFRCLSVDTSIRGQWGAIKSSCSFPVEAYWYSANGSGSSWTIPANGVYPLFDETEPTVLGCRPNEHLDRGLQLCRGALVSKKPDPYADRLAKELGLGPAEASSAAAPVASQAGGTGEAARLAKELGVSAGGGASDTYDAGELQNDLQAWETHDRLKREEAARLAVIEAERQRVIAEERARDVRQGFAHRQSHQSDVCKLVSDTL